MARLSANLAEFELETARLLDLTRSLEGIDAAHRKLIAEITLLRLSILIENQLKSIFSKIASGSAYIDGTPPLLSYRAASMQAAITAMSNHERLRPRSLKWNSGREIRRNIEHVIARADPCYSTMINHAAYLNEVRSIRNHIAHRNTSSRENFSAVVRRRYGGRPRGITCGMLLLTPRHTPPLLEAYIRTSRVFIRDLTKG